MNLIPEEITLIERKIQEHEYGPPNNKIMNEFLDKLKEIYKDVIRPDVFMSYMKYYFDWMHSRLNDNKLITDEKCKEFQKMLDGIKWDL